MKLLLKALLLTSVSVSITTASGDLMETPRGKSTEGLIPTAPVKKAKVPDQNAVVPEVRRSLFAEFEAAANAADESDNESNDASDSAFTADPSAVSSEDEYVYTPSDAESDA